MWGESVATGVDAIVQDVRNGNVDAFAEIVATYQKAVWQVTAYALDGQPVREDIVQQTFVDAYRHLDRFELGRDMGAWLRGIARNLVRQHLRTRGRAQHWFVPYVEYVETLDNPRGQSAEDEIAEALRQCREGLPEAARTVVDLRYEQDRSFEQVAVTLKRSVPAVRQWLQRIRESLRTCMEKKLGLP